MIRRRARRRGPGFAQVGGWLLLLVLALAAVVWRQTRAVALEREVARLDARAGVIEAERVRLERREQALMRRERIVRVARERFDMRIAEEHQIIVLPVPADAAADGVTW